MKSSLIITTYNESENIRKWCKSLKAQSLLPDEVIVVDSISNDSTVDIIREELSESIFHLNIIVEKCNISRGRNIAIENSSNEYILITDAGTIMHKDWVFNMYNSLLKHYVIAGNYELLANNYHQKMYIDTFENHISKYNNMPSSRSFAIRKSVWEKVGKYNEKYKIGEDTEFVFRILKEGYIIHFEHNAKVEWEVRKNIKEMIIQHFKYSYWDALISQNYQGHLLYIFMVLAILLSFIVSTISIYIMFSLLLVLVVTIAYRKQTFNIYKILITLLCYSSKGSGYLLGMFKKKQIIIE